MSDLGVPRAPKKKYLPSPNGMMLRFEKVGAVLISQGHGPSCNRELFDVGISLLFMQVSR